MTATHITSHGIMDYYLSVIETLDRHAGRHDKDEMRRARQALQKVKAQRPDISTIKENVEESTVLISKGSKTNIM